MTLIPTLLTANRAIRNNLNVCIPAVLLLSASGCRAAPKPTATPTSLSVTGATALTAVGQTTQLTATATFSDGTTQDVTSTATWQSSNTAIATVAGGLVTGVNFGQATITATFQTVNSNALQMTLQLNLTGTWTGSTADSSGVLQVNFVLVQTGTSVTGTGTFSGGASGTGTFTGTVSTTSNVVTYSTSGAGGGCTFSATGSGAVTGNTFSGTYSGTNSCVGPLANGLIALTKQ
jgi:hypothetical protein